MDTEKLLKCIVEALDNNKAKKIVSLDLRETHRAVCDYFVVAQTQSSVHLKALAYNIDEATDKELKDSPFRVQGMSEGEPVWVVLDYGDVVVHLFEESTRAFYRLEESWGDAIRTEHSTE